MDICLLLVDTANSVSEGVDQFTLLPMMDENFSSSAFSPPRRIVNIFNVACSNGSIMLSTYAYNLHFPNKY